MRSILQWMAPDDGGTTRTSHFGAVVTALLILFALQLIHVARVAEAQSHMEQAR
jgi:hypothetical protein